MKKKPLTLYLSNEDKVHFTSGRVATVKGYNDGVWILLVDGRLCEIQALSEILKAVYGVLKELKVEYAPEMSRAEKIRRLTGLSRAEYCRQYDIPLRTEESWERGEYKPPNYLMNFMEEVVKRRVFSMQDNYNTGGDFIGFCQL